jgi:hypothetical protein
MFAFAFVLAAVTAGPLPEAPPDAAVIVNSGSTNARGFRIVVRPEGHAVISRQREDTPSEGAIAQETATRFFADLAAAAPLDEIEGTPCMKSASFGVRITVAWHGKLTPDLACPTGPAGKTLMADIATIERELDIQREPPRFRIPLSAIPTPSP